MANNIIIEPENSRVLAKQNWKSLKLRDVNLHKGTIVREINIQKAVDMQI